MQGALGKLAFDGDLCGVSTCLEAGACPNDEQQYYHGGVRTANSTGTKGLAKLRDTGLGSRKVPPLWVAATQDHAKIVAVLLGAGADPAWADLDGTTALHRCCQCGHASVAAQLLFAAPKPIEVDVTNAKGATPLMRAVWNGSLACAELLLRAGADPTLPNLYGDTALQMAERKRLDPILSIIEEHRALCLVRQHLAFAVHMNSGATHAKYVLPYDVLMAVVGAWPVCPHAIAAKVAKEDYHQALQWHI